MSVYVIASLVFFVIACIFAAIEWKKHSEYSICDTCEHLEKRGGMFKYECYVSETGLTDSFDEPPEFCKNYCPRQGCEDDD